MRVFHGPDVRKARDGELAYVVSLSKLMRLRLSFDDISEQLNKLGKEIAETFENNPELNENLKNDLKGMRQLDVKDHNGTIIYKTFTMWNTEQNCWHVLMELPTETVWEDGISNV